MGSIQNLSPSSTESIEAMRHLQRANGTAAIMAMGTANPPNCFEQKDFADILFSVSNTEHKVELKEKLKRACARSEIERRYFWHDIEYLKQHPNICEFAAPSLNDRQDVCLREVPKLGAEAAEKALAEWGRPRSLITHLVFVTSTGVEMPSADYRLATLVGLRPDVSRYCIYMAGCNAGGTAIRYAKDLAENTRGARVLVVCAELTIIAFRGPHEDHFDSALGTAFFGDGAGAMIVGADPVEDIEKPLFQIVCAKQRFIPDSDADIHLQLREEGLTFNLTKAPQHLIADNIEECMADVFESLGMELPTDWNSLFWAPHPGGRAIVDNVEKKLKLRPEKFRATRHVLREYGNLVSACVIFVLDEIRKRSAEEGLATTGEGLKWGMLHGFGPGVTIETVLLHSCPI